GAQTEVRREARLCKELTSFALCDAVSAVEHREVGAPGADLVGVALRHDAADLADVVEVVHGPRRQELAQVDRTERRVAARQRELRLGEPPAADDVEVGTAQLGEAVEEPGERPAGEAAELGEAVERLEGPRLA